jgi:hypothetical protein
MRFRLIKLSTFHDRSDRDWNQRTVVVEKQLPHSLGPDNNLAADL